MATYLVTYFLTDTCGCGDHHHHTDHNHIESSENNIISKIKSLGPWANFMPEGYLVKSTSTANEILDEINSVSNKGDIIFVSLVTADTCATQNPAVLDWISK